MGFVGIWLQVVVLAAFGDDRHVVVSAFGDDRHREFELCLFQGHWLGYEWHMRTWRDRDGVGSDQVGEKLSATIRSLKATIFLWGRF